MKTPIPIAIFTLLVAGVVGYFLLFSNPDTTIVNKGGKEEQKVKPPIPDKPLVDAEKPITPNADPIKNAIPFTLKFASKSYANMPPLPGLQSYVATELKGKILILGGRKQGLHTFNPPPERNMPKELANNLILVIDPLTGQQWSFDTAILPPALRDPLQANNQQAFHDRSTDQFYLIGGYGWDSAKNGMVTFGTIMRFSPSEMIEVVTATDTPENKLAAIQKMIAMNADDRFAVTGGGLNRLGANFYLCLGQKFMGEYRVFDPGTPKTDVKFTQQYTQEIRVFTLQPKTLEILSYGPLTSSDPSKPLYRRDGTVIATIDPSTAKSQIVAFGGVFKPGTTQGYTQPITIKDNNGQPNFNVNANLAQKFSQYQCPVIEIYDDTRKAVYHTFFGGISHYFFRQTPSQKKVYDLVTADHRADGLPFIGDITAIAEGADGSFVQYILADSIPNVAIPDSILNSDYMKDFPGIKTTNLMGSSVDFLIDSNLISSGIASDNGVITLSKLPGDKPTTIGYIYGSIASVFPYALIPSQGTFPGSTMFEVTLTPAPSDAYSGDAGIPADPTSPPR